MLLQTISVSPDAQHVALSLLTRQFLRLPLCYSAVHLIELYFRLNEIFGLQFAALKLAIAFGIVFLPPLLKECLAQRILLQIELPFCLLRVISCDIDASARRASTLVSG